MYIIEVGAFSGLGIAVQTRRYPNPRTSLKERGRMALPYLQSRGCNKMAGRIFQSIVIYFIHYQSVKIERRKACLLVL